MAESYDANEVPADETPCVPSQIANAKLYLQKFCPEIGDSLYDHLSEVLSKVLAERPVNPFSTFQEYSKRLRDKFRVKNDYLQDSYVPSPQFDDAKILINLFKDNLTIDDDQSIENEYEDDQMKIIIPNLFDLFYYFEQIDVGLPRIELVLLNLSIRKLINITKIKNVRFWGKILGRQKNYYVLEAELPDDEIERRLGLLDEEQQSLEKVSRDEDANEDERIDRKEKQSSDLAMETKLFDEERNEESTEDSDHLKLVFPSIPINTWKPLPKVLPEKIGTGINKKTYFVCNSPGLDDWKELPTVTPQQIVIARQIAHILTGNLDAEIYTFPPFPGCEKNYLRAQIARIGAATQVSPIGYFIENENEEDEEEDEEEEDQSKGELVVSRYYKPLPVMEQANPANWNHHAAYILKQGREIPWNEADDEEREDEEGEEEEGEEDISERESEEPIKKGYEKEIGVALLRPLSEDASPGLATCWTGRLSSAIRPDTAVALVRSNVWPGAFAFATDKKLGNLYVGWGQKYDAYNYSPPLLPELQSQYVPIDSQLQEALDPSFEEEEAYRRSRLLSEDDVEENEEKSEDESADEEKV